MILDVAFALLVAGATAFGARVGVPAATVALLAPFAWLLLAPLPGPLALLAALPLATLALAAGRAAPLRRRPRLAAALGGGGGALLGVLLVVALATSLPLQRDPTEPDVALLHYPPRDLPTPFAGWVRGSAIVAAAAQVRFAPLATGDAWTSDGRPALPATPPRPHPAAAALHPLLARVGWTWDGR